MRRLFFLSVFVLFLVSATVHAEEYFPSIFKDCGIGGVITSGMKSDWARPVASLTNLFWDAGITAASSHTSGTCARDQKDVLAAAIVYNAYPVVLEDAVRGDGEYLTAVLDLMDIDQASRASMIQSVQHKVSVDLSDDQYDNQSRLEKAEQLFGHIDNQK